MAHVLVLGAGVSGCAAAQRLADCGTSVVLVEKQAEIGGRARHYGCKATDKCNNCGVCLSGTLFEQVKKHPLIECVADAQLQGLSGTKGDYTAVLQTQNGLRVLCAITDVVVCTGFESLPNSASAHLQIEGKAGIMTGTQLERTLLLRTAQTCLPRPPSSVAFIQCFGSRDEKERSMYCSRVCCAYSTRAARVLKQYYPECSIAFFYMELQSVCNRDNYEELRELGVEFIKCRPREIIGARPCVIKYDAPEKGMTQREFDLVVLSEGIHPQAAAHDIASLCGLQQDADGFLAQVAGTEGIYVAGTARAPMHIEEAYADAVTTANSVIAKNSVCKGVCV